MSGCETEAYNATQKWRRLQSKSCIFCDIFLSAIRDNFYFEGKHSQLLQQPFANQLENRE